MVRQNGNSMTYTRLLPVLITLALFSMSPVSYAKSASASVTIESGSTVSDSSETVVSTDNNGNVTVTTTTAIVTTPSTVVTLTGDTGTNTLSATTTVSGDTVSAQGTVYVTENTTTSTDDKTNSDTTDTQTDSETLNETDEPATHSVIQFNDGRKVKTEIPVVKEAIEALNKALQQAATSQTDTNSQPLLAKLTQQLSNPNENTTVSISEMAFDVPDGQSSTISISSNSDILLVGSNGATGKMICTGSCKVFIIQDMGSKPDSDTPEKPPVITIDNT